MSFFGSCLLVVVQGVSLFTFPHVKPIWIKYLDRFVERYEGSKLERARDLFEQVRRWMR